MTAAGNARARRYWWVNQNQTHREEIAAGFMWSPKRNANGARNPFYDNMAEVTPGDVVFSFYGTRIQHIGIVTSAAETAPKPAFGSGGENWSAEGWLVGVEFEPVAAPFRPKDHIDTIRPLLPSKYSPRQANGDGCSRSISPSSPKNFGTPRPARQRDSPGRADCSWP
jgi:putative restriction endonuclease